MLSREEADSCISVEFNPVRAGFGGGEEVWTRDVLNLGISPDGIIRLVRGLRPRHAGFMLSPGLKSKILARNNCPI